MQINIGCAFSLVYNSWLGLLLLSVLRPVGRELLVKGIKFVSHLSRKVVFVIGLNFVRLNQDF